jgi:exoribonuclease-2
MNVFFEESGDFKVGSVLSTAGEAYQVELASGKRSKVKIKDVLLQFEKPAPEALLDEAKGIAAEVDLDFLWEVAGQEEFGFAELGAEYFGHAPLPAEAAGLVLALHNAPIYFYKKGRGRYKAAPEQSLRAAQAGIEKKKQQALIQAGYVDELKAGTLPAAMQPIVAQLLFKPDKNTIEYKALEAAANELQTTAPRLMLATKGVASPKDLHMGRFLFENFPRGAGFQPVAVPSAPTALPLANVAAFSIDDVTTTEIDDAFSVEQLEDGNVRVGIHIAAPGLAIKPDDEIDKIARSRMSTVYMPGDKITMLPDEVVNAFTLAEGNTCPALSLYATLNPADWSTVSTTTRAELVPIQSNLRHNDLDELVNEETLESGAGEYPHKAELGLLWKWALKLEAGRMVKREAFGQPRRFQFLCRGRRGLDRAPQAWRAAGQDRGRADDFREQHLGQAAARLGRAGHLPLAGRRQRRRLGGKNAGAHGHARGAAPGPRCRSICMEHLAAAPLHRPGEPVANHRLCRARRDGAPGRSLQTARRDAVLDRLGFRRRLCRL